MDLEKRIIALIQGGYCKHIMNDKLIGFLILNTMTTNILVLSHLIMN
jgi:hypothetical protein